MKTYRVGIIGFGMIGKVHAYGYATLPYYYDPPPLAARITHVVTSRRETAEKARRLTGADVAAVDFRAVTENPEIDIVHICSPNDRHFEALQSAIAGQKHIYCDKPLVATADEARQIAAVLAGYRGTAQMTFQYRFYPSTLRAKQLVDEGRLGRLLQFRAAYLHAGSADARAPARWKLTAAAGGGVIADLASHVFDLVEHLAGPIEALMAETSMAYAQRPAAQDPSRTVAVDAEDCALMLVRMQSGARGTIEATKIAVGAEDELRIEIHGTQGALRFNLMDPHHLEFFDATLTDRPLGGTRGWTRIDTGQRYEPPAAAFPSPKAAIGWTRGHVACLANFLQAVAEGRPAEPGLAQGIRVQQLMDVLASRPASGDGSRQMADFPEIFRVRQKFARPRLDDVAGEVHAQLVRLELHRRVRAGQSVAITAGSRGIANIAAILRAAAQYFQVLGAQPFLVPAMGSHGGATAEGQLEVLATCGITEAAVGCPIRASMETAVVGRAEEGFDLHIDRHACEADHVLVCGRVKPHTSLAGDFQSGLMKMLLIGLGKHVGAGICHRAIEDHGFDRIVRSVADQVIAKCRVVAGLALVENAYDETALIEAMPPAEFESRDPQLLAQARQWMARLPFDAVDVLVIDRMGKNISGVGFDPNVVGRKFNDHQAVAGERPRVRRICVRGLARESHGNAIGLGMSEFCRTKLLGDMDPRATRVNSLTSGHIAAGMTPLDYETDREMLAAALGTIGLVDPPHARLLWIADTLHLAEVECSAAYLDEARQRSDLEIVSPPRAMEFDGAGNLAEGMATAE